jgi:hypothetical protein
VELMLYRWEMCDRLTGEVRSGVEEMVHADMEAVAFIWTEGNDSCDVNRAVTFYDHQTNARDYEPGGVHNCMLMPNGTRRFDLISLEPYTLHEARSPDPAGGNAGADAGGDGGGT